MAEIALPRSSVQNPWEVEMRAAAVDGCMGYSSPRAYECPRCDGDTEIFWDRNSGTCGWYCPREDCDSIGFGFPGRMSARKGLKEYRERFKNRMQDYR